MFSLCMAGAVSDKWAPQASSESGFAGLAIPTAMPATAPSAAMRGALHGLLLVQLWGLSSLIVLD